MKYWIAWRTLALFYASFLILLLVLSDWRLNNDAELTTPRLLYGWKFQNQTHKDRRKNPQNDISPEDVLSENIHLENDNVAEILKNKTFRMSVLSDNVMAVKTNNHVETTSSIHSACVVEPLLECHNIGFAALLLLTMEQLAYCHNTLGSTPTVIWRNCHAVCSKNPHFNSWNWYFKPINPAVELTARKVVCVAMVPVEVGGHVWLGASFRKRGLPVYDDNELITTDTRQAANDIIRRYVIPNRNITRVVEELYTTHLQGNNLLGVHVRGTDHTSEIKSRTLPPIKMWIEEARLILNSIPAPSKIFIAGDNSEVLVAFREEFGKNKVFFTKALRAKFYTQLKAPHDFAGRSKIDSQRFGSQVLIDTLLLAKCRHFLHAEASVANLATFFNPGIKSHFLGELTSRPKNWTTKLQEPVASRSTVVDRIDDEVNEYQDCFIKNGAASSCPNMAAGNFILPSEVETFLAG